MPQDSSFDIVSKVDLQEVQNAIQQTSKEIATRFDLKGTKCAVVLEGEELVVSGDDEHRVKSVRDILETKLVKRGVPLKALDFGPVEPAAGGTARQRIKLQQGIPIEKAREIVKLVKGSKIKVQVAIQGDQLRVSGKKKDDLQDVMKLLRESNFDINMQFVNYR